MRIGITLAYRTQPHPSHAQPNEMVSILDAHEVELAETTGVEAPVALTYHAADQSSTRQVRAYGGRLWEPAHMGLEGVVQHLSGFPTPKAQRRRTALRKQTVDPVAEEQDRATAAAQADQRAREDILVIDGVAHVLSPEPYLEVRQHGGAGVVHVAVRTAFTGPGRPVLQGMAQFRADQMDAAMALAQSLAQGIPVDVRGAVQVLDSSALRHDPQAHARRPHIEALADHIVRAATGASGENAAKAAGQMAAALLRLIDEKLGWSAHERAEALRTLFTEMDTPAKP